MLTTTLRDSKIPWIMLKILLSSVLEIVSIHCAIDFLIEYFIDHVMDCLIECVNNGIAGIENSLDCIIDCLIDYVMDLFIACFYIICSGLSYRMYDMLCYRLSSVSIFEQIVDLLDKSYLLLYIMDCFYSIVDYVINNVIDCVISYIQSQLCALPQ